MTPSVEEVVQKSCSRGDYQSASTMLIESYGVEIISFILAKLKGDESAADDVYAEFLLDLWRGLPQFEWRCSVRAWCYTIARSAVMRFWRSSHRRRGLPLSEAPFLESIVAKTARSSTLPYLRTDVKDEFAQIRKRLSDHDQDLLILRVDRNLCWEEIVHALAEPDEQLNESTIKRRAAALRQNFVDLKKRIRALARESGLFASVDSIDGASLGQR